jgi:alpha-mannosidase
MTHCIEFDEISVLIPGYSLEDLPTDLDESRASSLLNAAVTAWHPLILVHSRGVPKFRQAESLNHFSGRHVFLVPSPAEDWMPHEWQQEAETSSSLAIGSCESREDWLSSIHAAVNKIADGHPDPDNICCIDDFFAFGLCYLLVVVLSRRMHHFIDPDDTTLEVEIRLAAAAAVAGNEDDTRTHLQRCFDSLRDTREQFYPLDCYLVDLCVPAPGVDAAEIRDLIQQSEKLNLVASAREVAEWCHDDDAFANCLQHRCKAEQLTLVSGSWSEQRPSLGSMLSAYVDLVRGVASLSKIPGQPPISWGRKRFGLAAGLPALLTHFGFEFALHFALDDGSYPEEEHSWFEWRGKDDSRVPATSRIPLATDSAASMLRFPDRCRESMQDDASAIMSFARLPHQTTCWPDDLRRATKWAPVLGHFATLNELSAEEGIRGTRMQFRQSEYLSPHLIQASVLKIERPVSDPARIHRLWTRLSAIQTQFASAVMLRSFPDATEMRASALAVQQNLNDLERERTADGTDGAPENFSRQCEHSSAELSRLSDETMRLLQKVIPSRDANVHGLLVSNSLPFARTVPVDWPAQWSAPASVTEIEGFQSTPTAVVFVKLPPGGFVWLTESHAGVAAAETFRPGRREPPLAEPLLLRNRFFEVTLSSHSGGIEAVRPHGTRANLLSQRPCFRFDRKQDIAAPDGSDAGTTFYADASLVDSRVIRSESIVGEVETTFELRSPADNSVIATGRQIISVDRFRPRIDMKICFDQIARPPNGNPWLTYLASRFAWDSPDAVVTRGVLGQACDADCERFETPDYLEIADAEHRVVISVHGRPYHRRSGDRMLDSLLVVDGETETDFQFTFDFDQSYPMNSVLDVIVPPVLLQTSLSVPSGPAAAWLLGLSSRNVIVVRGDAAVGNTTDDDPESVLRTVQLTLLETEGSDASCVVRTAKAVRSARICAGIEAGQALEVGPAGVTVPIGAFQLKDVELTF